MKTKWIKIKQIKDVPKNKKLMFERRIYGAGAPEREGWESTGIIFDNGRIIIDTNQSTISTNQSLEPTHYAEM